MPKIVSPKKFGFKHTLLHQPSEPNPMFYLSQRSSFWIATLSVIAFVMGNMVGQHGWYVFLSSVLGKGNLESTIVYTGTVPPIKKIAAQDWGGSFYEHTFRQVPTDKLIDLPSYDRESLLNLPEEKFTHYSLPYLTGYNTKHGSHPAVDIIANKGTPIYAIANGLVVKAVASSGFGNYIILKHPNAPHPTRPTENTTLYSIYAHNDVNYVSEGEVVAKGQKIATVGDSGLATAPHLHFQIDLEEAITYDAVTVASTADNIASVKVVEATPFHPYWPFTSTEASSRGLSMWQAVDIGLGREEAAKFTIDPMAYVQANFAPVTEVEPSPTTRTRTVARRTRRTTRTVPTTPPATQPVITQRARRSVPTAGVRLASALSLRDTRDARLQRRLSRQRFSDRQRNLNTGLVTAVTEVASTATHSAALNQEPLATVRFQHQDSFRLRRWTKLEIFPQNAQGEDITSVAVDSRPWELRLKHGKAKLTPSKLSADKLINGRFLVNVLPLDHRQPLIISIPQLNAETRVIKVSK